MRQNKVLRLACEYLGRVKPSRQNRATAVNGASPPDTAQITLHPSITRDQHQGEVLDQGCDEGQE